MVTALKEFMIFLKLSRERTKEFHANSHYRLKMRVCVCVCVCTWIAPVETGSVQEPTSSL